ncbi:MAG: GDP-mannose 4,6-dehydratase, partial [Bdellovibrionota bacterium]
MKLLVTGAGGFIGSHVVEACVAEGHDVRAFVRYNSRGSWGWLEGHALKGVEMRAGDIRDYDSVLAATKGCDGVLHLAALIGIPYSYESPLAYVRTNVEGTYNVLQASRELGLKQVLVTSTSETYGTAQRVPIDENHPAVGQSPYSASKIAADQLAISY